MNEVPDFPHNLQMLIRNAAYATCQKIYAHFAIDCHSSDISLPPSCSMIDAASLEHSARITMPCLTKTLTDAMLCKIQSCLTFVTRMRLKLLTGNLLKVSKGFLPLGN